MTYFVSNCGSNENGGISGGQAGDQTGNEWRIREYYSYPWTHVLRYHDEMCMTTIALLACLAAQNDNIGYDQPNRISFSAALKKAGYNPALIHEPCSADCSSGSCAIINAAGHLCEESCLSGLSVALTSRTIRSSLEKIGWYTLTGDYLKNPSLLKPGDQLLAEGKHICTFIGSLSSVVSQPNVSQSLKVDPAKNKDSQYNKTYYTIRKTSLLTGVNGKIISELEKGAKVRCYGYFTGAYLYVSVAGMTGFIYFGDLAW